MLNNKINVSMKLTMKIKCVVLLLCSFTFSSCCTLFCAKTEAPALTITSTPSNADVYLNKKYVGKTPYNHFGDEVDVKKITVKKTGYESQKIKPRKLNGWAYVNFFPYPVYNFIWGYFLDRSQSKCWKYKNDVFHFNLKKNSGK
ncbi:MAG: PEGA domain-containing protein [Bacteroidales bacterium]|nr:PEGA domain-containing protein [Bacteroidales bacterium]